jgi:hypothetical protein
MEQLQMRQPLQHKMLLLLMLLHITGVDACNINAWG